MEKLSSNKQNINSLFSICLIVLFVFLISSTFSCSPQKDTDVMSTETTVEAQEQDTTTSEDSQNIEDASTSQSQTSIEEVALDIEEVKAQFEILRTEESDYLKIFQFIDENIEIADTQFADEMVDFAMQFSENELFPFQDKFADPQVQQIIWADFNGSTDLEILKNSENELISMLALETLQRKYKLEGSEGYIAPIVDYEAYKAYDLYISDEMKAFIGIMALESEKTSVSDAAIVIPLDEFVDRIMMLYDFEETFPGFIRIYYIVNMLNGKLWIYMGGIDNTPVFNFSDNSIIQERLDDFKANVVKYEGTRFAEKLNEYLEILENENYKRTQEVADYLDNLTFY